jgi:hypothetical protein
LNENGPLPPTTLLLGFLGFSLLGFAKDWRLGVALFAWFGLCVGLFYLLCLRYQRAKRSGVTGQAGVEPSDSTRNS